MTMTETFYCLPCNDYPRIIDTHVYASPGSPYRISYLTCGHHAIESWSDSDGADYQIRWEDTDT